MKVILSGRRPDMGGPTGLNSAPAFPGAKGREAIMRIKRCAPLGVTVSAAVMMLVHIGAGEPKKPEPAITPAGPAVMWREPADIATRDLYYGPGGKSHAPLGTCKFLGEDMGASSPKFDVVCEDGIKWKAKLGVEARPEVAASRLLWAVGYFANEDYFEPIFKVENLPHLRRGDRWVRDGAAHDVRLKRHNKDEKRIGTWAWKQSPFTGTREWYGLRVLMAVINNWDLKDVNNAIYQVEGPNPEQRYIVSDLGASFGTTGLNRGAKGDVDEYMRSKWMSGASGGFVDFNVPSAPGGAWIFHVPEMKLRLGLTWIGHHIPVEDARWMGSLLARLSTAQIRDAFRAGGYSDTEAEEFTQTLEGRIRELNNL